MPYSSVSNFPIIVYIEAEETRKLAEFLLKKIPQ